MTLDSFSPRKCLCCGHQLIIFPLIFLLWEWYLFILELLQFSGKKSHFISISCVLIRGLWLLKLIRLCLLEMLKETFRKISLWKWKCWKISIFIRSYHRSVKNLVVNSHLSWYYMCSDMSWWVKYLMILILHVKNLSYSNHLSTAIFL